MCSNCKIPKCDTVALGSANCLFSMLKKGVSFVFIGVIRLYQSLLSPLLPNSCRFVPTCSEYGVQAFLKYNPLKAFWLTSKRIGRCNPWGGSGYDPLA